MVAFTIFFCGTGSNSFDFANKNYHAGELVSTLARNHSGLEFVDWIQVDGPGSGNLQEAEKWVPSGNYTQTRGTLEGKGWEENVAHAIAVFKGVTTEGRETHTKQEVKKLRAAGVGEYKTPGKLWGEWTQYHDLHPRITPQALQMKRREILGQGKVFDHVNVIGWSRGGVTCHMFANAMAQDPELAHIPVNIFACDPVPGAGQFQAHRYSLIGANVDNYVAIFADDERSQGFTPVYPMLPTRTRQFVFTIPGRHATLVGNASIDGNTGAGANGINGLVGPGRVTRDLAERYLTNWGTTLNNKTNLSAAEVLTHYDDMVAQQDKYRAMHNVSYTYFTQKGPRPVGIGDGTFVDFHRVPVLQPDPHFINRHHRGVFATRYPTLYQALFEDVPTTPQRLDMELFNLKMMYPKLFARWVAMDIIDA